MIFNKFNISHFACVPDIIHVRFSGCSIGIKCIFFTFVENVENVENKEQKNDASIEKELRNQMKSLFNLLDVDNSQYIDKMELLDGILNRQDVVLVTTTKQEIVIRLQEQIENMSQRCIPCNWFVPLILEFCQEHIENTLPFWFQVGNNQL